MLADMSLIAEDFMYFIFEIYGKTHHNYGRIERF